MDWAQRMIDFATQQATRIAKNYASELCICPVVSANDDGSNAVIKWNNINIGSELLIQTPFTIENVVELPEGDSPTHYHEISAMLNDCMGITAAGKVKFVPTGIDISAAENPDGTIDMEILAEILKDSGDVDTLHINHDHGGKTSSELPKVRIWRGVKAGDSVLVLKVNPSCFVMLTRLNLSNDPGSTQVKTYGGLS